MFEVHYGTAFNGIALIFSHVYLIIIGCVKLVAVYFNRKLNNVN